MALDKRKYPHAVVENASDAVPPSSSPASVTTLAGPKTVVRSAADVGTSVLSLTPVMRQTPPQREPSPSTASPARDAPVMRETPAPRDTPAPREDAPGLVCPFCANIRTSDAVGPCPRCTMEDTATARRSTGERIGPWFVLQRKNPTAPGLRFNVLLALARRGHVTVKSIVRGPTSGQLWRFASQVKGLSRVFGLCWHCSASISPEAISCPRCKSPQDVPGDADAFLETPANLPVMRDVSGESTLPSEDDLDRAAQAVADEADPIVPVPEEVVNAAARRAASIGQAASGTTAPRTASETIMSARELAAVFSLDSRPTGLRHRAGRAAGTMAKFAAAIFLLGGGAIAAALVAKPEWRAPLIRMANEFVHPSSTQPTTLPTANTPAVPQVLSKSVTLGTPPPAPAPKPAPVTPVQPEPVEPKPADAPALQAEPEPKPTVILPPESSKPVSAPEMSLDDAVNRAAELRRQALEAESRSEFERMVKTLEEIETLRSDAHPIDLSVLLTRGREKLERQRNR
jgi:hypothetical protein